ncbi:MAG: hypothetical protein UY04_C0054G0005 [Parcubacteria group bacterium GW2011_GWA2_47_7]|nr:MAG: hypothetical protein UY04_C0054G0005 [Parcubacteria group bacterium GW2011_GWA2_47_7]
MRVGFVPVLPQGAEEHDGGFHGVGRVRGPHLESLDVVPGVHLQVVHIEIPVERALVHGQERGEFLFHGRAHQGRGVVFDAVVRAQEHGQAVEVVVVGVGMEDALDFVHADAQCAEERESLAVLVMPRFQNSNFSRRERNPVLVTGKPHPIGIEYETLERAEIFDDIHTWAIAISVSVLSRSAKSRLYASAAPSLSKSENFFCPPGNPVKSQPMWFESG